MIKKRNIVIVLTAIILLQLGFITYMFAFQKEGVHSDDNWSYGFANADEGGWIYHDDSGKSRNFNKWTDGKVLWDYITVQKGKQFDFGAVARNMSDERNPPLHHMILHAICSFFPESFSWWYGYAINVLSFIGMMIALYFLGKEFLVSVKKALLICFFYGFSVAALNNMLFLRPYCLLTCFSILLIYFHVRMYRKKFHSCRKELIGILITMIAGNLTQYTFMMFGMCLMLTFGIYEFSQKKWKFAIVHGLIMLQSVIITIIVWPHTLDLILTRNQMYAAQMPLLWEINFSMLLSVEESTGIPFRIPDIVFWTYVKFIMIFLIIIAAGVSFICRKEVWFQNAMKKGKDRAVKAVKWIRNKVRYGEKISILLMLTVFLTIVIISYYCNIYVMSLYADRYFFFVMPFITLILGGQICWLIQHLLHKKEMQQIVAVLLCGVLLFVEHNVLTPSWYLFQRQCDGPQIEELTKDTDVILITSDVWKLTWYSSKLRNVSQFYAVLAENCMTDDTLNIINRLEDDKPVYLVFETDKFRDESWDTSKSKENAGVKTNEEILTLSYKKSEVVNQIAKAIWAKEKKFIQKENSFAGQIEVWQLR